jgi:hypothetical protein
MSVDPTVTRFLIRAGILSKYHQFTWFSGCRLQGPILWVPDPIQLRVLTVSYLADLQAVRSDLELRLETTTAPHTPKGVYRGKSGEPTPQRLVE